MGTHASRLDDRPRGPTRLAAIRDTIDLTAVVTGLLGPARSETWPPVCGGVARSMRITTRRSKSIRPSQRWKCSCAREGTPSRWYAN